MPGISDRILRSRGFRSFIQTVEDKIPPLRAWRRHQYELHFQEHSPSSARLFSGVYPDRQSALAAIPAGAPVGYEALENGERHARETGVWPSDYAIIFWLKKLLAPGTTLFEVGGSVGRAFYSFQRYLSYPPGLRWTICELAPVTELGEKLAKERGARELFFTTRIAGGGGATIFLASGTLQFLPEPLSETLRAFSVKPTHLLLNRVPLWDGPAFATLHNVGQTTCAYEIFNKAEFTSEIERLGYSLVDEWETPEFSCHIPFHPERSISAYTGMYFRLKGT